MAGMNRILRNVTIFYFPMLLTSLRNLRYYVMATLVAGLTIGTRTIVFTAAIMACVPAFSQVQAGGPASRFAAASIRASSQAKNGDEVRVESSPGSLTLRGVSLEFCVEWAYDMPMFQVQAPGWMKDAGFDVVARSEEPAGDDRLRQMLRTLLAERFGLQVHTDRREMPVYVLALAPGGPKFSRSDSPGPPSFGNDGVAAMTAKRVTISEFAAKISEPLGRPVLDGTGLQGRFDISINVTSYMSAPVAKDGELDLPGLLFTALQKQLGVRLQTRRSPVDILVVDRAEKVPTEN